MNLTTKMAVGAFMTMASFGATGAFAATNVTADVSTSTTWTKAGSPYQLRQTIHVLNGATLTIEPGVIVLGYVVDTNPPIDPNRVAPGILVVTRGSKIFVNGTKDEPVIMTSAEDVATWTGSVVSRDATDAGGIYLSGPVNAITTVGNPKTGTLRSAANEWGNLTILGRGLIAATHTPGSNAAVSHQDGLGAPVVPNTGNLNDGTFDKTIMEGLVASGAGDPKVLFGGDDDNDDSGAISYLSLRYGGRVLSVGVELNGLSLGGVGRETQISHVDIMNNLDDGIEIWGGTVDIKYASVWNIGDDSFDLDMGWRGRAQFLLLVQGYSFASGGGQGSGIGDNVLEMDGAERGDKQPWLSTTLYNVTAIGQPNLQGPGGAIGSGGDTGAEFRDGARVQIRNSIFMNLGERLVLYNAKSDDGTAGWGYGDGADYLPNGTVHFHQVAGADIWDSSYTEAWNIANTRAGGHPSSGGLGSTALQAIYSNGGKWGQSAGNPAIQQGYLAELTDSVFYSNTHAEAYLNSNAYRSNDADANSSITLAGASNPAKANVVAGAMPIKALSRAAAVNVAGGAAGLYMGLVNGLDPRAANDAVTSHSTAPADGFFTPAPFRGAFSKDANWAKGWTAADAYGIFTGTGFASEPATTSAIATTVVNFTTVNGVSYVIESSTDGQTWTPELVVEGDGNSMSVPTELGGSFSGTKIYRVSAL